MSNEKAAGVLALCGILALVIGMVWACVLLVPIPYHYPVMLMLSGIVFICIAKIIED